MPVRNFSDDTIRDAKEYELNKLTGEPTGVTYWSGILKYRGYEGEVDKQKETPYQGKYIVNKIKGIDDYLGGDFYTIQAAKEDFKFQVDYEIENKEFSFLLRTAKSTSTNLHIENNKKIGRSFCYKDLASYIKASGVVYFSNYCNEGFDAVCNLGASIENGAICKKCIDICKKKIEKTHKI